jgi:GH15 family glucan-1,4-alpha-glucosidase
VARLIEDYGLIGDGETAALVHREGAIEWLCWPRFDSDACFAALLGTREHGYWQLSPIDPARVQRRYQPDTLVLETHFETGHGAVRLTDFMPIRDGTSVLVRMVKGLRGNVHIRSDLKLRFDYGSIRPWIEIEEKRAVARVGPDLVALYSPAPLRQENGSVLAEAELGEGEDMVFTLAYGSPVQPCPEPIDAKRALAETQTYWREWIAQFDRKTDWPQAVRRSLITLKSLIYRPSGAIVAAPTTSLPEKPGGETNWDYRFAWIRDSTFMFSVLLDAGYRQGAIDWRNWLLRALAGDPDKMRIMYRVDGSRRLDESIVEWLPGFRWTSPVRIGNSASAQHQLDIFGETINTLHLANQNGIGVTREELDVVRAIVRHVECVWRLPDQGLWESRGRPRHYVYSKVSSWVAVDRYAEFEMPATDAAHETRSRVKNLAREMHDEICREGYDQRLGRFVEYYGGQTLDASLLLLPLMGFLPVDDDRIARTIAAIENELMEDGFVRRWKPHDEAPEGAFLACSCWLADCQLLQGRHDDARRTFERVLSARNDLGLLSEEYDVRARQLAGNFPQALSHIALVRTALRLSGSFSEHAKKRPQKHLRRHR